jgi:F0F1-type ATP synthase assembly protein I
MQNYYKFINLGAMMIAPAIVGLFIGIGIDKCFGIYPFFTVAGLVVGIVTGYWSMYKAVKDMV